MYKMGRYKFPGKPTKLVNKKRINVLSPATKINKSSSDCKESLNTFYMDNPCCDAHNMHCIKTEDENIKSDNHQNTENELNENRSCSDHENVSVFLNAKKSTSYLYNYKNYYNMKSSRKDLKRLRTKGAKLHIVSKVDMPEQRPLKIAACNARRALCHRKKQIKDFKRETANLVGKFILPSKSLHSSRVIIPNKRFINNEQITNDLEIVEKKTKTGQKSVNCSNNSKSEICFGRIKEPIEQISLKKSDNKDLNDMVLVDSSGNSNVTKSCGKLILRKARLQLRTHISQDADGPFSSYSVTSPNPPGTVTCGVCGAVRFYRFVKQARKFNIYSCESCRKFISKMIKRQTCSTKNCSVSTLVCHKGQGMCHVPPIVRSQQWKLLRCAYKARCPACWLKMCLQSFQMPLQLKLNLMSMLPENMRTKKIATQYDKEEEQIEISVSPVKLDLLSSKTDTLLNNMQKPDLRIKKTKIVSNSETAECEVVTDCAKRQKLELKGPRVKHVCRSASIVLGQPLATFSRECNSLDTDKNRPLCEASSETDACINCVSPRCSLSPNRVMSVSPKDNIYLSNPPISDAESCVQSEFAKNSVKPVITVSSDYFDNYDSEGKLYTSGFGLIGSEPFTVQAVCFYCGSAGQEQLLYCACCCEPYHYYCINDSVIYRYFYNINVALYSEMKENFYWKLFWNCPRCSVCYKCGKSNGTKITCHLCHRYFHCECMQADWKLLEKPMICSSCLQCEDCGSQHLTNLVSNVFICLPCFKLRMKGKFCELCFTFDENSSSKMIKCYSCDNVIHAECENLSGEMYEMLHYSSSPFVYVCSICSLDKKSCWKESINLALKNGFHIVLRSLIRSRIARNIMKWNLNCSCLNENIKKIPYKNSIVSTIHENDIVENNCDNNTDITLNNITRNICLKEYLVQNCVKNNHCRKHTYSPIVLLLNIKRKINSNVYKTIKEFHVEVQQVLKKSLCHDLLNVLDIVIKNTFPWYNPLSAGHQEMISLNQKFSFGVSQSVNCNYKKTYSSESGKTLNLFREKYETTASNKYLTENNKDTRLCVLCHKIGDGSVSLEGRLLYCGQNEWIHINCAFWSSEVYEELDCTLYNVQTAISRSRSIRCSVCKEIGATIHCSIQDCNEIFHYMCARVVNCVFLASKNVYCSSHYDSTTCKSIVTKLIDFEMQRPIYIQMDLTLNKHLEVSKVQYLIGSLYVTNLGTFFPPLSDTDEAIIPSEFVCSRFFWSTTEPWKIIRYKITTSIIIPTIKNVDIGKNLSVNHSLSDNLIAKKVKGLSKRTNALKYEKYKHRDITSKQSKNITDDDKIVLQILENLLESICNRELEESCDDEPQNTADILPPELKDAIFEDLPHDLLDGISVQDIIPKLMSYEDAITADLKNYDTSENLNPLKNNVNNDFITNIYNMESSQKKSKKADLFVTDLWFEPKYTSNNLDNFSLNKEHNSGEKLKRSKSEIITGIKKFSRISTQQRPCSLTWNCKLDNARMSNIKKRKLSCASKSVTDISSNLFMLVDSKNEKSATLQGLRIPDSVLMSVAHTSNVDCLTNSVREIKYCLESNQTVEHEKENNCRIWHNKSQSRIAQIDGADDSSSASESESHNDVISSPTKSQNEILFSNKINDEPVKCTRCQCTYRTVNSYKKHLTICNYIILSESDSEEEKCSENNPDINSVLIGDSSVDTSSSGCVTDTTSMTSNSKILRHTDIDIVAQDMNIITQSVYISPTEVSNVNNVNTTTCNTNYKSNVEVNQVIMNNTEIRSTVSNIQNTNDIPSLVSIIDNVKNSQKNLISKISTKKLIKHRTNEKSSSNCVPGKNKKICTKTTKRTRKNKSVSVAAYPTSSLTNTNRPVRLPAVQNNSLGPTIIIQHLSSPNLMPAYVEAFQHQTGQNLQCIATIIPQECKSTPYLTSNPFIPDSYAIQTLESSNLISIPTEGFPLLSNIDTVPLSRPVLTSFMQQNRPATNFQCGMMSTEQLVMGSLPTVDTIVSDIPGSLYLSSSPVYYGFEAIVQNTVSQQFISTLPGILTSNSSYSATSTHVFQSNKVEPMMDINSTSYMVVNSAVPQIPTPVAITSQPLQASFTNKHSNIMSTQQSLIEYTPTYPMQVISVPVNESFIPVVKPVVYEQVQPNIEQAITCVKSGIVNTVMNKEPSEKLLLIPEITSAVSSSVNPGISHEIDNKIPVNIVTPTSVNVSKPTNRVLPMQTIQPPKQLVNNKIVTVDPPNILNKLSQTVDKIKETLQNDVKVSQSSKFNISKNQFQLESASLKLVFQKQSEEGIYKISNKYVSKKKVPMKKTSNKKTRLLTLDTINKNNNGLKDSLETKNQMSHLKTVSDNSPNILYKVESQDGFDYSSTSISELWKHIFSAVQTARIEHKMPMLSEDAFSVISGLQLLGLKSNGLKYLIEQLPGVGNCIKYKSLNHRKIKFSDKNDDNRDHSFQTARCKPYFYVKQPYDMFSWLASKHRNPEYIKQIDYEYANRKTASINLPMAMRFRQLKETSKQTVGVYRSGIHGRGLFCLRDIEYGEMVIEYAGEVIRSTLTDKREKYYNSKGIGCYMFRVDDNFVIDATMKGNAARFINHSCDPNCYSKVLEILGHKHILIFALRKIIQGEELTYDYKFPFEEDKIPCTCGAKRCRKYLN